MVEKHTIIMNIQTHIYLYGTPGLCSMTCMVGADSMCNPLRRDHLERISFKSIPRKSSLAFDMVIKIKNMNIYMF